MQTLQTCGTGFVAFVFDTATDVITVKTPSASHLCGPNLVYKPFHGDETTHTAGHAQVDLSGDDNIT